MPDLQTNDKPEQKQSPAPASATKKTAPRKGAKLKLVKRVIAIVVTLAILSGIVFGVWWLVFRETEELGEIYAEPAMRSSIQSSVQGSGYATAKDNATITVPHAGVIDELLVSPNETVYAGQPLFVMSSPEAQKAVEDAQQKLLDAQEGVVKAQQAVTEAEKNVPKVQKGIATAEKGVTDAEKAVVKAQEEVTKAQQGVVKAQEEVTKAQQALRDREQDLADLRLQASRLTITAPFSGKIVSVEPHPVGSKVTAGTTLATLVNDKKLQVSLYFSYAYENEIKVGQSAQISIPAMMFTTTGRVEEIHKINFISPEGGTYFEAVLSFDNPGTLAADMSATASLTASDGTPVYPYDSRKTQYAETRDIIASMDGPIVSNAMVQYLDVAAGQTLAVQGPDELNKQIEAAQQAVKDAQQGVEDARAGVTAAQEGVTAAQGGVVAAQDNVVTAKEGVTAAHEAVEEAQRQIGVAQEGVAEAQKGVAAAEEALAKAQEDVGNLNATAPIDGVITSCTIEQGSEVKGGDAVITIQNNTNMVVTIRVDNRNIGFISLGSTIELSTWEGNTYMGTVTNIDFNAAGGGGGDSMGGMMGGGMGGSSGFPVTLEVENFDGSLYSGAELNYSFITSQSEDCIVVQTIAVKSVTDSEGNKQTVVFVQREDRPENAIDLDYSVLTGVPKPEEGYWPVLVETGLSDAKQVEIKSGIEEGDTVFISYTDPNQQQGTMGGVMIG